MNIELIKNVEVTYNGKKVTVDIERHSRNGSKSPQLDIYIFKGKRITPFEQRIRGWGITLHGLFKTVYSNKLSDFLYQENHLMKLIKKDTKWSGSKYVTPVVLGK